jgi:hypothetical protein
MSPEDDETEPENQMQTRLNATEKAVDVSTLFKSSGER